MRCDGRGEAFLTDGVVKLRLRGDEAFEQVVRLLEIHFFDDAAENVGADFADENCRRDRDSPLLLHDVGRINEDVVSPEGRRRSRSTSSAARFGSRFCFLPRASGFRAS